MSDTARPDPVVEHFLRAAGLLAPGARAGYQPLPGGVSSDIWRVDLPDGTSLCVKRALPRLKVASRWEAPVARNASEWAWLRFAAQHLPQAVPRPIAHDPDAGLFAMEYLAPEDHPVWKQQLLAGRIDTATAGTVGELLGRLHAASAGDRDIARAFDTLDHFHALRLEPYLLATARRHRDLGPRLEALAARTAATTVALVHGDVSPKNLLVGPRGPVFLDAECAWYGDPAFDLAFCLNHLLLKALAPANRGRAQQERLAAAFDALATRYFAQARFEPRAALEARAASLLPALLLARVDGKSPVEYLTEERDRGRVRASARALIRQPPSALPEVAGHWYGGAFCAAGRLIRHRRCAAFSARNRTTAASTVRGTGVFQSALPATGGMSRAARSHFPRSAAAS